MIPQRGPGLGRGAPPGQASSFVIYEDNTAAATRQQPSNQAPLINPNSYNTMIPIANNGQVIQRPI